MKTPYLQKRGRVYQFSRRVPDDVREVLNQEHWRESLKNDSETEAVVRCRKRAAQTDEIIKMVRDRTYRLYSDEQIDRLAFDWSIEFQRNNHERIARAAFPHVWDQLEAVGDESENPIIGSREQLKAEVVSWLSRRGITMSPELADLKAMLDTCNDAYLAANPELSDGWKEVIDGLEYDGFKYDKTGEPNYIKVVPPTVRSEPKKRLSVVFDDYKRETPELSKGTEKEWTLAVERFKQLHGDIDVTTISKSHARQYRNILRRLPKSCPNSVRKKSVTDQVTWADQREAIRVSRATVNKNLQGVSSVLNFSSLESEFEFPAHWTNPFIGLQKKSKSQTVDILPFSNTQIQYIFSEANYQPRTPEKFWIPLLLLWTGARVEEIAQMHVADVQFENGLHIVVENAEAEDEELAKNVKTLSSNRRIPLAEELVEIGFLNYLSRVQELGCPHLFPGVTHDVPRKRGEKESRSFREKFRKLGDQHPETGLNSKSFVTHSLRHSFRTNCFELLEDLPKDDFVSAMMGHYIV